MLSVWAAAQEAADFVGKCSMMNALMTVHRRIYAVSVRRWSESWRRSAGMLM